METVSQEQSPLPEPVEVPSLQLSEQIDTKNSQPASDKETDLPNSRATAEISAILESSDISPANSSFPESSLSLVDLPDTAAEEESTGDISALADGKEDFKTTSVIDETCVAAEKSAVSEASKPEDTSTAVVLSDSAAAETFVGGPATTPPQIAMDVNISLASDIPGIEDKSSVSSSGVTESSSVETVVVGDSSTDSSVIPKIPLVQETALVKGTALVKETMQSDETAIAEETVDVEKTKSVLEETNKNAQEAKNVEEITHVQGTKNVQESNNAEESKNDDQCKNVKEVKNVTETTVTVMETSSVEETIKADESSMIQNSSIFQEAEERMTQSVLKSSISLRNVAQSVKLSPSILNY